MSFSLTNTNNIKNDLFSGLTVALALVPEAVAFAFVAGVDPLVGLYAAFLIGLITSIFGGRPGMISGATGALAVVMVHLVSEGNAMGNPSENLGLYYLFLAVILMGIIQMIAGLLKLGKFVRLIPHPVMMGFVNGLAIVIFLAQIGMFKKIDTDFYGNKAVKTVSTTPLYKIVDSKVYDIKTNTHLFNKKNNVLMSLDNTPKYEIHNSQVFDIQTKNVIFNYAKTTIYDIKTKGFAKSFLEKDKLILMLVLVALTMLIMWGLPKIKLTSKLPSALVAIVIVSTIVILGKIDVSTVGSFIREGGGTGISGKFPLPRWETFSKVPLNWDTFIFILPYAVICAAVGLIESLMTLNLIDDLTDTRGNANRECLAQGGANIITGLFGGMGGCAMIGQSVINIKGGGRGRLSGIFASIMLLVFILFGGSFIERIPIAVLVGVMFMVVIGTFAWSSFRIWRKIPKMDLVVLILVSSLTVIFDLAIAVLSGVILSALVFAWQNASRIRARKSVKNDGTKVYEIWGPLFFGSISSFNSKFDIKNDPKSVEVDFLESRISDHSALEALFALVNRYEEAGKTIHLKHLSQDCKILMHKASEKFKEIIIEDIDDPRYHLAEDPELFVEE